MLAANTQFVGISAGRLKLPFAQTPAPIAQDTGGVEGGITLTAPSGTGLGDLLVSLAYSSLSWTPASGFTERLDSNGIELATLVCGGAEPSTYFVDAPAGGTYYGTLIRFTSAAYDTIGAESSSGTSPAAPAITMSAAGKLLAIYFGNGGTSFSTPSGMTPLVSGTNYAVFIEDVASGSTGTRTSNASGGSPNSNSRGVLLGVIPA
jgi:hypothetical protein